ncbi:uncharacterized protein LOC141796178 [Halichoeres trimaculatus]|uniref:uncharacterized protein LOC141796178 n=1 Tax=Halichoeres trimaculatus TaxID=147232 RepID=UPI003D9E29EE
MNMLLCLCEGGGSAMDQCEDREEGAPPSKTLPLCGDQESQTRAQSPEQQQHGPDSPGPAPSCVSLKSDLSKDWFIDFKAVHQSDGPKVKHQRPDSPGPGPSCVSLKSDWSIGIGEDFKSPETCVDERIQRSEAPIGQSAQQHHTQLDDSILMLLQENIISFVKRISTLVDHGGQQWLKPGLKKYFCELTLDSNTAYRKLRLSENNREVTRVEEDQSYPDHPDRFDVWAQLLCRDGLTGRCYWEVEVAVYVDCLTGTLSFYRVSSDSLIHLHTYRTTFTQPLYPGFGFGLWIPYSSVSLCSV